MVSTLVLVMVMVSTVVLVMVMVCTLVVGLMRMARRINGERMLLWLLLYCYQSSMSKNTLKPIPQAESQLMELTSTNGLLANCEGT